MKLQRPNNNGTIKPTYIKSRSPPARVLDTARPNNGQSVAGKEEAITKYLKPDFMFSSLS